MKIDRTCPRCRAHRYHLVNEFKPLATCAECSHQWKVRLDRDEREDQKQLQADRIKQRLLLAEADEALKAAS